MKNKAGETMKISKEKFMRKGKELWFWRREQDLQIIQECEEVKNCEELFWRNPIKMSTARHKTREIFEPIRFIKVNP